MSFEYPKFNDPPVVETVLGVQFKPLTKWQLQHIGLFSAKVRGLYPNISVHPPLHDETEGFGETKREIRITMGPSAHRIWLTSNDSPWLIQVQNSKFYSNWRKQPGAKYPDYKTFKEHFSKEFDRFRDFLTKEKIESPLPEQVEVTYINHIEVDDDSWNGVFNAWNYEKSGQILSEPEALEIRSVFPIDRDKGRLYFRAEPVVRHDDGKRVVQLSVTAKVLVKKDVGLNFGEEFNLAHTWVVCGFTDFTTSKMHEKWGRVK